MTDRSLFGVAVRAIGVWLAAYEGAGNAISGLASFMDHRVITTSLSPEHRFINAGLSLVVGILLIKGEWLVRIVYGSDSLSN